MADRLTLLLAVLERAREAATAWKEDDGVATAMRGLRRSVEAYDAAPKPIDLGPMVRKPTLLEEMASAKQAVDAWPEPLKSAREASIRVEREAFGESPPSGWQPSAEDIQRMRDEPAVDMDSHSGNAEDEASGLAWLQRHKYGAHDGYDGTKYYRRCHECGNAVRMTVVAADPFLVTCSECAKRSAGLVAIEEQRPETD